MKITKTAIGNHLRRSPNGDVGMYRNGFKDGVNWTLQKAQAQAAERCKYCDNTGDVHSPTGEWRGVCTECKQVARQEPVANVTISNWRGQGENIEWQMQAELPEGTHLLFTSPPPDHRDAPQAAYDTMTVECLNDIVKRQDALLKMALNALELSRDDVALCLEQNKQLAGYERYDKRIAFYKEQLIKHDAAIAALEGVL